MPPYKTLLTDEYKTFKQKFGIVSFIIPNNLKVTTYTEQNFNGILGGPYSGPLHVPQANWYKIWSLKIESVLPNPDDEESDEGDEDGAGKKSDDQKNSSGKEEGNRKENINPEETVMNLESGKGEAAVEQKVMLKDNVDPEMTNNKESSTQVAEMDAAGKELDSIKQKGHATTEAGAAVASSMGLEEETHGDGREGGDRKENINNEMAVNAVDMYLAKSNMVRYAYFGIGSNNLELKKKKFLI